MVEEEKIEEFRSSRTSKRRKQKKQKYDEKEEIKNYLYVRKKFQVRNQATKL